MSKTKQNICVVTAGLAAGGALYFGGETVRAFNAYDDLEQANDRASVQPETRDEYYEDLVDVSTEIITGALGTVALFGVSWISMIGFVHYTHGSGRPNRPVSRQNLEIRNP